MFSKVITHSSCTLTTQNVVWNLFFKFLGLVSQLEFRSSIILDAHDTKPIWFNVNPQLSGRSSQDNLIGRLNSHFVNTNGVFPFWYLVTSSQVYMGYGQHLGCGGGFPCNFHVDIVNYCMFLLLLLYKCITKTGTFCGAGLYVCKGVWSLEGSTHPQFCLSFSYRGFIQSRLSYCCKIRAGLYHGPWSRTMEDGLFSMVWL